LRASWPILPLVGVVAALGLRCSHGVAFVVMNDGDSPVHVSYEIPRWAFVEPTVLTTTAPPAVDSPAGGAPHMGFYSVRTDSVVTYDRLRIGSDSSVRIMEIWNMSPRAALERFADAHLTVAAASGTRQFQGADVLRAFRREAGSLRVLDVP
jgi:hypothetical protein